MKEAMATCAKFDSDDTGAFVSFDWVCPHCDFENTEFVFTHDVDVLRCGTFETERECSYCFETVAVHTDDLEESSVGTW